MKTGVLLRDWSDLFQHLDIRGKVSYQGKNFLSNRESDSTFEKDCSRDGQDWGDIKVEVGHHITEHVSSTSFV